MIRRLEGETPAFVLDTERTTYLFRILPSGHPEGVYEAFANIYRAWIGALLKKVNGQPFAEGDCDFPTVEDGLNGVKFIHACVESSKRDAAWVEV